jgi:hypothetical protein
LAIGILIANVAMKFIAPQGLEKCGVFALVSTALWASSRSCQYLGAFIAPLPTEKNMILIVKSSLRHWQQVPFQICS